MTMLCGGINLSIIATANACSLVMAGGDELSARGATALATLLAGGGAAMIIGLCNGY